MTNGTISFLTIQAFFNERNYFIGDRHSCKTTGMQNENVWPPETVLYALDALVYDFWGIIPISLLSLRISG